MNTAERSVNRSRRWSNSHSSMTSLTQRGPAHPGFSPVPRRATPWRDGMCAGRDHRRRQSRSPPSMGTVTIATQTKSRCSVGDEDSAARPQNSNARCFSNSSSTAAMPSRSQIRPNNEGPPMRFAANDNDPSASSSSALIGSTWSVSLAPDESSEASAPDAIESSARRIGDDGSAHSTIDALALDHLDISEITRLLDAEERAPPKESTTNSKSRYAFKPIICATRGTTFSENHNSAPRKSRLARTNTILSV